MKDSRQKETTSLTRQLQLEAMQATHPHDTVNSPAKYPIVHRLAQFDVSHMTHTINERIAARLTRARIVVVRS